MFKGAFTIATISGIPVRMHWTFLLLLAWVFGAGLIESGSFGKALVSLAFIGVIFFCVVLHEFGHITVARAFGIRTRDVTLLPIGGVAALERLPEKPWQELAVAVAGPVVNVVIALALLPGILWHSSFADLAQVGQPGESARSFLTSVAAVNIWLVLFNAIPAFPMDGGRVLRALLAMFTSRMSATRIAARIGQGLAAIMALVGLFAGLPMLIILALFVFLGAGAEASGTQAQETLRDVPVSDVMVRSFRVLGASETLRSAVDELLATSQTDFPVTEDGAPTAPVVGLLTRSDLVRALADRGPAAHVRDAMRRPCDPVRPGDPVQSAMQELRAGDCPLIPVVDNQTIVGLLTAENISEAIMVRAALGHSRAVAGDRPGRPAGPRTA